MCQLFFRNSIAGAVAREVRLLQQHPELREGLAYKSEWDRRGSDALKHVASRMRDEQVFCRFESEAAARRALAVASGIVALRSDDH